MKYQDIMPAALAMVLIGLVLAVGLTVLANVADQTRSDVVATNDQFTATNSSFVTLGNSAIKSTTASFTRNGATFSADCFAWDDTDDYDGSAVKLLSGACSTNNSQTFNASYTYGAATVATTGTLAVSAAVDDFPTWLGIIVLVIAAAIIIGLVVRGFGGRG